VYDTEQVTVLDLVAEVASKTNEVVDDVNGKVSKSEMPSVYKLDDQGDFTGTICSGKMSACDIVDKFESIDTEIDGISVEKTNPLTGKHRVVKSDDVYNSWPVIIQINNSGKHIMFYASRKSHKATTIGGAVKGSKVNYKITLNDGLTWSEEKTLLFDKDIDYATFGGMYVEGDNSILLFVNENVVNEDGTTASTDNIVVKSFDEGETFENVYRLNSSPNAIVRGIGYPNYPIALSNGKLMAFKQSYDNGNAGIGVIFSSDNGNSWGEGYYAEVPSVPSISDTAWEIRCVEIFEGKIIAFGRNDLGSAYQLTSDDYGVTWTKIKTNIDEVFRAPLYPVYIEEEQLLCVYTHDRNGARLKKVTIDADYAFNNPTAYPKQEVVSYIGSQALGIDSGYLGVVRLRNYRNDVMIAYYGGNPEVGDQGTEKKTAILITYDTVNDKTSDAVNPNKFINGGLSVWQEEVSYNPVLDTPLYTASQWIYKGTATTVARSASGVYDKSIMLITGAGTNKVYQGLEGMGVSPMVASIRALDSVGDATVKLYIKYTEGAVVKEYKSEPKNLGDSAEILSFPFTPPNSDTFEPMFIGFEIVSNGDVSIYDLKLEDGYIFTGLVNDNRFIELQKCLMFLQIFDGIQSFTARADGNLMQTIHFIDKLRTPTVTIEWQGVANKARAWDGMDVGTADLTVNADTAFVRFFGTAPSGTPDYYDVDKIVVDGRYYE